MALEKFHYKHDGKDIVLPKADAIPFGVLRKMRKASDDEQFYVLVENMADAETLEIIDAMPVDEVVKLIEAWGKANDSDMGESKP